MKDLISVSGYPGLFKIINSKGSGIIVEDLNDGKRQFIALRSKNNISPLETIAIYTNDDSVQLSEVFITMQKQEATLPLPDPNSDNSVLTSYFKVILPDYNELKVKISDIKKVIKWYNNLKKNDLLPTEETEADKKETAGKEVKKDSEAKKNVVAAAKKAPAKMGAVNKGANSPKVTKPNKSK